MTQAHSWPVAIGPFDAWWCGAAFLPQPVQGVVRDVGRALTTVQACGGSDMPWRGAVPRSRVDGYHLVAAIMILITCAALRRLWPRR